MLLILKKLVIPRDKMMNRHKLETVWDIDPISSLLQRIHYRHTTKGLRSLSILSEHRSEGKTTLAMLIARGLSEIYKFKIILIDLNPEGDTLLNHYLKDTKDEVSHDGILKDNPFGFSIFRLKNIDMNWLKNSYDGLYTNQIINTFSEQYDLVIVDTFTNVNASDSIANVNTNSNIVVCSSKSFEKNTNNLQKSLESNRKEVLGIIFNK